MRGLVAAAVALVNAGFSVPTVMNASGAALDVLAEALGTPRRDPETSIGPNEIKNWRDYDRKYQKRKAAGYPDNFSSLPKSKQKKYQRRKKG